MITATQISNEIDALWVEMEREQRDYIGASEIGHVCERYLWLKFHRCCWPEAFDARMLRLFNRGHREEFQFQEQLKAIGFKIIENCQGQGGFRQGFFAGHWDGKVERDGLTYTVEYKTHSDKSFKLLQMDGVKESKPMHYAQMATYAKEQGSDGMIYMAVNKNDDDLHIEVFPRDDAQAQRNQERADRISTEFNPPAKIARSVTDHRCKYCTAKKVCHGIGEMRIDCRNCAHVDKANGKFTCELGKELTPCDQHTFNPLALADCYGLKIETVDAETKTIHFLRKDGSELIIGKNGMQSDEVMNVLCS